MVRRAVLSLAAVTICCLPALAQAQEKPATQQAQADTPKRASNARIPFANRGGIWNWRSEGNSTIYFEDNHRQWYKATLFGPAFDLPYVNFIGIDAGPTGTLDRFGAVYIRGQRYPFSSFVKIAGKPPKKGEDADKRPEGG